MSEFEEVTDLLLFYLRGFMSSQVGTCTTDDPLIDEFARSEDHAHVDGRSDCVNVALC